MRGQAVGVGAVADWYGRGWRNFREQPGPWIALILLYVVIGLGANVVPVLGPLALTLLGPALGAGLLHAAREGETGRPVALADLFAGLTDRGSRGPLLALGVGVLVAMFLLVGLYLAAAAALGMDPRAGAARPSPAAAAAGLGLLAAGVAVSMALFFAVPLVHFARRPALEALGASLAACLRNLLPLLAYGLSYAVLAVVASIPFGLGMLILGPVGAGASYACYSDIFPQGADSP